MPSVAVFLIHWAISKKPYSLLSLHVTVDCYAGRLVFKADDVNADLTSAKTQYHISHKMSLLAMILAVCWHPSGNWTEKIWQITAEVRSHLPVSLKLVIKRDFIALSNRFNGKKSDAQSPVHGPFLGLRVRVAAMIYESWRVTFASGIDHLQTDQSHSESCVIRKQFPSLIIEVLSIHLLLFASSLPFLTVMISALR